MKIADIIEKKPWIAWILFGGTLGAVLIVGLLGASIMERRQETQVMMKVKEGVSEWDSRNHVWGAQYPREYETFLETSKTDFTSKYQGSATRDLLQEQPKLAVMWAGYPFSRDYKQARGHFYAVKDIRETLRTTAPLPGTCWACKSPDVPRVMHEMGTAEMYKTKWPELGSQIVNSIGCLDCHDPNTMNLRISRPALAEAWQRQGKDISKASLREMRSLVCAQCHVEYFFKGKEEKYLTFPWDKGYSVEAMEAYYDEMKFYDWVHPMSRAPMLKAQHPDYEVFMTGIHAERGVSCADCHMPYRGEGGVKFTDHHIQSPLNNISNSCAICHRETEETLRKNVYDRQNKVAELLRLSEDAVTAAHIEAKAAWDAGATESDMATILVLIRHAQWRWDWVAASNGVGFHSPAESLRVLGTSIQKAQEARRLLLGVLHAHGAKPPVMPDLSTKEKAQAYVGLDIAKLKQQKKEFLENTVPKWDKAAAEREAKMK